ncbi:RrF2 family transcriptional regulator [Pseudooceanicola aestuarii]|uniref:RrF2 family transcriptional regulator n=1 Tax=Pseudooceanicola aestuarii TaxID=2697319 RepID=UPI0013D55869
MRLTKRTNLALRVLMYCAVHDDRLVTKAEIAAICNTSENHLAQVIHHLAQLGFLHTQRGRRGGMTLGRPAEGIRVGAVFRQFEGALPVAECFDQTTNTCPLVAGCRLRRAIARAAEAFYAALDDVTLDALVCGNVALAEIMTPPDCSGAMDVADRAPAPETEIETAPAPDTAALPRI